MVNGSLVTKFYFANIQYGSMTLKNCVTQLHLTSHNRISNGSHVYARLNKLWQVYKVRKLVESNCNWVHEVVSYRHILFRKRGRGSGNFFQHPTGCPSGGHQWHHSWTVGVISWVVWQKCWTGACVMWGITIVQASADHVKDHSYKWTKTEKERERKKKRMPTLCCSLWALLDVTSFTAVTLYSAGQS